MSFDKDNWAVPTGLSRNARKLALAIVKLAKERNWYAGQKVFWSPKEWKEKGERYGEGAAFIVIHEGGDHAPYFSMDHAYETGSYKQYEEQLKLLSEHDFWSEGIYRWSTSINEYKEIYKLQR